MLDRGTATVLTAFDANHQQLAQQSIAGQVVATPTLVEPCLFQGQPHPRIFLRAAR